MGLEESMKYAGLATSIHKIMAIITFGIGFNLTLIGFRGLIEKPIPFRYYLYLLWNLFVVPFVFNTGFSFEWTGDGWAANYHPSIFRFVAVSPALFVGIEIGVSTFKLIRHTPYNNIKIVFVLMTSSFLLTVPSFLLREKLKLPFNFFILPIFLYFMLLTYIIWDKPKIFLTTSIDPHFLLIIDSETGIPMKTFHFVDNVYKESDESLFAGALTSVEIILKELSSNNAEITYIGMKDTHIVIERATNFEFILGSEKSSYALKSLLRIIAEEIDHMNIEPGLPALPTAVDTKVTKIVTDTFIHQLNRLDLRLQSVAVQN